MVAPTQYLTGNKVRLGKVVFTLLVALISWRLWDLGAFFFLGLLAASVTGLIDGLIDVTAGLLCIACCPLLLIVDQSAWLQQSSVVEYYAANLGLYNLSPAADQFAIWAFYFLCIGVAALSVQYATRGRSRGRTTLTGAARGGGRGMTPQGAEPT